MKFTADDLRGVTILEGLADAELAWFADHGSRISLKPGERMFERGDPADFMFVVVGGALEGYALVGGQELLVATTSLPQSPGHSSYQKLNQLLGEAKFDEYVETAP